jgi:predicted alpha/beta-fold hydrolase
LQTLRNVVRGAPADLDAAEMRRLLLPMADGSGDRLAAALYGEPRGAEPLAVLLHGLGGSEESDYLRATASLLRRRGLPALLLNLRGAGPSRPTCRFQYHAGRTADLRDALVVLQRDYGAESFFLVGFSLGGNMLLKFLAEHGGEVPLVGAASVSAPLDLRAACQRILERRNRIYHRYLLGRIRGEALGEGAELTERERRAVVSARSILEFDANFVAPRNGYASADEYYERNSSGRFLHRIDVPTLVVHALDDPWIPGDSYRNFRWASNPNLTPLLSAGGGHVGFHAAGSRVPWHDRCIEIFLCRAMA